MDKILNSSRNYYELLELEPSAEPAKIKAAFRRLARKYHPDMNPGNPESETIFKRIGEAYNVLSDPQKRAAYDQANGIAKNVQSTAKKKETQAQQRSSAKTSSAEKSDKPSNAQAKTASSQKRPSSMHVEPPGTGFKDMFDTLFRKSEHASSEGAAKSTTGYTPPPSSAKKTAAQPLRGEDITIDLVINREEAKNGTVKMVSVQHTELCRRCSGTGRINSVPCSACNGEKQTVILRKIEIRIPAGVKGGSKVRVAKEGSRGIDGGEPGDLFLLVHIEEDKFLKVDGLNVSCELSITIPQAVLGTELEVPTLHGKVKMTIPQQTSSGKQFKLKGQGVTLNGVTGDQFVTVQIIAPKTLSNRERELYEELARLQNTSEKRV